MWSYGLNLRSIRLTVVKVVVSSEGTCNNCLFVEVFNYFLKRSDEIFDFLTAICDFKIFVSGGSVTNVKVNQGFGNDKKVEEHCSTFNTSTNIYEKTNTE